MSHSTYETYDVYNEAIVQARKQHACDACERTIEKGHYYCRLFTAYDGETQTVKRCGACQKTHLHLRELCMDRDRGNGEMWPDERLGCGLDYEEEWGDEPPEEIEALPFLSNNECGMLLRKEGATSESSAELDSLQSYERQAI